MAYIDTKNDQPGIRELFAFRPETGRALSQLAETILRGPSSLTPLERELIAAVVSHENDCFFCHNSHAAAANALAKDLDFIATALKDPDAAGVSKKVQALLVIARHVARSGREVTPALIEQARTAGASDEEIHDGVIVAAAFCMFNRYVDGLGARTPKNPGDYIPMGEALATVGYLR